MSEASGAFRPRGQGVHVNQLVFAPAQRFHVAHQGKRETYARADMRTTPSRGGHPFDVAGGKVEAVDDGPRQVEQLAQRSDDRGSDFLRRLLRQHRLVDLVQDAQPGHRQQKGGQRRVG